MAENEKDPPLADKPKVSSLTDFEIRALKLQKEGKGEEVQKEIEKLRDMFSVDICVSSRVCFYDNTHVFII